MYFDFLIVNYLNVFYFTSALVSLQYGDTPLHIASANGHKAVVEVLLNAGADHSTSNRVSQYIPMYFDFLIVNLNVFYEYTIYKYTCVITAW